MESVIYKPILFNEEMVNAILSGRKTKTRRAIKPQPSHMLTFGKYYRKWSSTHAMHIWTPPACVGDVLWVRETWAFAAGKNQGDQFIYKADGKTNDVSHIFADVGGRWRPSIHMPKEAARIFLRTTNVMMERLQDIDEEGVCDEGAERIISACEHMNYGVMPPEPCFNVNPCKDCIINYSYPELFGKMVWDKTIKPADLPSFGWAANPWVWVIEFERIEKPEGWK